MGDNGSLIVNSRGIKPPMKATLGVAWVGPMGPLDVTATAALSGMREGNLSPGIGGEASLFRPADAAMRVEPFENKFGSRDTQSVRLVRAQSQSAHFFRQPLDGA